MGWQSESTDELTLVPLGAGASPIIYPLQANNTHRSTAVSGFRAVSIFLLVRLLLYNVGARLSVPLADLPLTSSCPMTSTDCQSKV